MTLPGLAWTKLPRGTRSRLRPMEQCLNRTFSSLRPQPHSRSPRSLRKARGLAERPESTRRGDSDYHYTIAFGKRVRSRADLPAHETVSQEDREVPLFYCFRPVDS